MKMRPEMMLLLLVAYFLVLLLLRKYVSSILWEATDILAWQHEHSHGRALDGAKDKLRGIIRKGIVQRNAARRFARKNIQFTGNVDVYSRKPSEVD